MLGNKLVRSDGSIIDSSVIISCEFTEEVNSSENLSVGDVTSSEINLEIRSTDMVEQNEVLTYYVIEDGVETLIGVFNAEKPTVASRTSIKFSAYDNIVKSEKIFSEWLRNNQSLFPMTLGALVTHACEYCGLTLATTAFPRYDIEVNAFYADDITCRQILSWASAIAGRFVRANSSGEIEFAWYADAMNLVVAPNATGAAKSISVTDDGAGNVSIRSDGTTVADDGKGNVSVMMPGVKTLYNNGVVTLVADEVTIPYKQGGMSYEVFTTDYIERVQIKQSDDDVGVIYPMDVTGNCFAIRGNMILGTCSTETVTLVATRLYEQLCTVSYVPAKATLPRTVAIRAGDIIHIRDSRGAEIITYVMKMSVSQSGTSIESTGNKSYDTNAAVASEKYANLTGKILEIKKTVDGLSIKNQDLEGRVSGVEVDTKSIKSYVEDTFVSSDTFTKYRTEAEQTALGFEERFERVEGDINATSAQIKRGILYHNEDNIPIYGIEIGQTTEASGVEVFNKYARFTSEKMSFYDQSGNEVTQIGDRKMSAANIEITGNRDDEDSEYGSFKQGGFLDTTLANGDIVSKWVGGG